MFLRQLVIMKSQTSRHLEGAFRKDFSSPTQSKLWFQMHHENSKPIFSHLNYLGDDAKKYVRMYVLS